MSLLRNTLLACAVVALIPAAAPAQQVFKEINSQKLEDILRSMDIQFTKGDDGKGTTYYDYKSKGFALRLYNFSGKDLMIDIFLLKVDWETINKWNGQAKFSRARLHKDAKTGLESAVLESNLDLLGGVTEDTIKHFIRSFDLEVSTWSNKATAGASEEEIFKVATADRIEKILNDLKIQFQKSNNGKTDFYDFKRNNFKMRLTNFGGSDLMIDCVWNAAPLTKLNQWNLKKHYIRAVLYGAGGKDPFVALESNLDCVPGVSESIIRNFITIFDNEAAEFDKHLAAK